MLQKGSEYQRYVMPDALELRKVIEMLKKHGIEFDAKSGGRHSGKFVKENKSFPVKSHGAKQ